MLVSFTVSVVVLAIVIVGATALLTLLWLRNGKKKFLTGLFIFLIVLISIVGMNLALGQPQVYVVQHDLSVDHFLLHGTTDYTTSYGTSETLNPLSNQWLIIINETDQPLELEQVTFGKVTNVLPTQAINPKSLLQLDANGHGIRHFFETDAPPDTADVTPREGGESRLWLRLARP